MSKLTLVFPLAAAAFIVLVFAEYIPLLRQPLTIPEDGRRMARFGVDFITSNILE